jgi:outer membrane lipoprotein-sorting protein
MKRFMVTLGVAVCLVFAACAQKPTVDSVVNKMVQAQGGAEKLASMQDQVSTWDSDMTMTVNDSAMNMATTMTITYKRPNKIKFENVDASGNAGFISIFDGTNGWVYMVGMDGQGAWRDMAPEEIQETTTLAETWADGWHNYAAKGITLVLLADTTMDGKAFHRVQATDKFGNVSVNYCDTQTGLIERTEAKIFDVMTMQKVPTVMTFSEYASHDGFMVPGKFTQRDDAGMMSFETRLKEVKHNTGVADDVFAKPAMPMAMETPNAQ